MGWKGAVRSYSAAVRRAERENERQIKILEKANKAWQKQVEFQMASDEVFEYKNYLESVTSIHKECSEQIDWIAISNSPEPTAPVNIFPGQRAAEAKLINFKPNFFQRIFKREEKIKDKLKFEIELATKQDSVEFEKMKDKFRFDHFDWFEKTVFAKRIVAGDVTAFSECILEIKPLNTIPNLGMRADIEIIDRHTLKINLKVKDETIIPKTSKDLLKSGKVSLKEVPQSKFFQIYQDYVSGCALRAVSELFALLPVDCIYINAKGDALDSATGLIKESIFLSAQIPRETIQKLNMTALDPSDAFRNFNHRVNFKPNCGFQSVEEVRVIKKGA